MGIHIKPDGNNYISSWDCEVRLEALTKQGFGFASIDNECVSFMFENMMYKNNCGQMEYTVLTLMLW